MAKNGAPLLYHFYILTRLFRNIDFQHFYRKDEVQFRVRNVSQYIHWYEANAEDFKRKKRNDIFKRKAEENTSNNQKDQEKTVKESEPVIVNNDNMTINEGIERIDKDFFSKYKSVSSVTLPKSLTDVEYGAFKNSNISKIILSEGITSPG